MPWDEFITLQFELIDPSTTDENDYCGPFNTLLQGLFPSADHYQVAPQLKPLHGFPGFSLFYVIKKRTVPIFFLQVKTATALNVVSLRKEADEQMRDMFLELAFQGLPIPHLYGVSAMGTRFSVYEYTTSTWEVVPPRIISQSGELAEAVGSERWNYDVMESQGEAKFKEIVAKVKEIAANSRWNCKNFSSLNAHFSDSRGTE